MAGGDTIKVSVASGHRDMQWSITTLIAHVHIGIVIE